MNVASARRQRGWSLLETAIATALLGMMVVAVVTTAKKATDTVAVRQAADDTERADNALFGYTRTHARMPVPDDSAASPSRPGYIEGWLPVTALGIDGLTGRIRYVVAESLTLPQSIYVPDPTGLGGGAVNVRTTANGLDLCANLMRRERAGDALPGGMRMAYALQQAIGKESGLPLAIAQSWLGDSASGPLPADTQLNLRTRGYGEMATALDCFAKFSDLSRDVRSTAVAIDLRRLAEQELALRQLQHEMGEASRLNAQLRMTAWGLGGAKLGVDAVMETVTLLTSAEVTAAATLNVVSLGLLVAGLAELLEVTVKSLAAAAEVEKAESAAIKGAESLRNQFAREISRQALRANTLQDKGLGQ